MTVRDDRIVTLGDGVVMGGTPGICIYLFIYVCFLCRLY